MKVVQSQKSRKNPKSNPFLVQQQWVLERVCTEEERERGIFNTSCVEERERSGDRRRKSDYFFFYKNQFAFLGFFCAGSFRQCK